MRKYASILNLIICILLIHPTTSYTTEVEERTGLKRELFSIDFSKTNLELSLLATIIKKGLSKAIIKNPSTGKIKTYVEGEVIDLINIEEVKLVRVSDCIVMIEREGRYETLECNTNPLNEIQSYKLSTPLARYKIVDTPDEYNEYKSKLDKFKSDYEEEIIRVSKKHKVDPYLVKAVIKAESNFNPLAVSPKNAMGIMQLMPDTARDYGVNNLFDPEENINGGVSFLRDLMNYFNGDLKLALAAYNAGKGAVVKHGFKVPPYSETIDYVEKVLGYYRLLKLNRYE
jgi:hypothetical protein